MLARLKLEQIPLTVKPSVILVQGGGRGEGEGKGEGGRGGGGEGGGIS